MGARATMSRRKPIALPALVSYATSPARTDSHTSRLTARACDVALTKAFVAMHANRRPKRRAASA